MKTNLKIVVITGDGLRHAGVPVTPEIVCEAVETVLRAQLGYHLGAVHPGLIVTLEGGES